MWTASYKLARPSNQFRQLWKRFFLSDSYSCQDIWNKRMSSPVLQNIKASNLYHELDVQFQHFARAEPLEIDFFANVVKDSSELDEIEDIVHKFRLSPETINMFPSTHHAIIRFYLATENIQPLIKILNNRLSYGIYPDDFCNNLLMNFLNKKKMFREAAKVATMQMLQEDFKHPITKYFALYSCLKYLKEPTDWHEFDPIPEPEPEDDVKVRVRFLINPFNDDHFDLTEPDDLLGKTLLKIGVSLKDSIGNSCVLLGLGLRKKLAEADDFIQSLLTIDKEKILSKDAISLTKEILEKITAEGNVTEEFTIKRTKVLESLNKLENLKSLFVDKELITLVEEKLKEVIKDHEINDIQNQCKLYEHWEKERVRLLAILVEERERKKRLADVNEKLLQIESKEEELYFFENLDQIDIKVEEKLREISEREEKLKHIKKADEEEYIPPEIIKAFPSAKKNA